MLHTKFHGNRPASSGEEDFEWFLPYMGVQPSWSCDLDFAIKLSSPYPWMLHIKFHFDWPSSFREEDL